MVPPSPTILSDMKKKDRSERSARTRSGETTVSTSHHLYCLTPFSPRAASPRRPNTILETSRFMRPRKSGHQSTPNRNRTSRSGTATPMPPAQQRSQSSRPRRPTWIACPRHPRSRSTRATTPLIPISRSRPLLLATCCTKTASHCVSTCRPTRAFFPVVAFRPATVATTRMVPRWATFARFPSLARW